LFTFHTVHDQTLLLSYKELGGAIVWKSRTQKSVALSSAESELTLLAVAVKSSVWVCSFLEEFEYKQDVPTILHEENQSCICLTRHDSKHIKH